MAKFSTATMPRDEAVVAKQGDTGRRAELESRLAMVLGTNVSRDAKDFVCRTLMVAGSAAVSTPTPISAT